MHHFLDKYFVKKAFCLGLLTLYISQAQSQEEQYTFFDTNVGIENTGLYTGLVYTEKYRTINENTQFFTDRSFKNGNVFYDGQQYYNVAIRYDIYEDEVSIKLVKKAGGGTLTLIKDYIESFEFQKHKFINISSVDAPNIGKYGYYEELYASESIKLYAKHKKKIYERKDRSSIYYEFIKGDNEYIIEYNNIYKVFNTKKEITNLFPEFKSDISKFYGLARNLNKSNPNNFKVSLIKRIEILLADNLNQGK